MRIFKILGSRRQPAQKKPTQEKRLKEEASNEHAGSTALLDDPSFQGKKDRVVNCMFSREVSVVHYRRRTPRLKEEEGKCARGARADLDVCDGEVGAT